jgi:hypothetical protein
MRLSEKEGGRAGVIFVCFLFPSEGDSSFFGSSSVRESVTGAMDDRGGWEFLDISGVDWAYGVNGGICKDGSGGIAVIAPVGIFQSFRKSGEMAKS